MTATQTADTHKPMAVYKKFSQTTGYMGLYNYGDDIIVPLQKFCAEHNIRAGLVSIIGAVKKCGITFYNQATQDYVTKVFEGDFEIISCTGNLSIREGHPWAHLHITISDDKYQSFSGHLLPGQTELFCGEFVIQSFDEAHPGHENPLVRTQDAETGLWLWK